MTLPEMIEYIKENKGLSYADLSTELESRGTSITGMSLSRIRNGTQRAGYEVGKAIESLYTETKEKADA